MFKTICARDTSFACLVLAVVLLGRGIFMEFHDLIDPTESRYASVAQEMVLSNNWLTPHLPQPEGVVPYLGKPPLHFWLTAISYKMFGFEEWSSRLPSFLDAIGILAVIYAFCASFIGRREAIAACTIAISSGLFFFLAGASVIDVTLTLLVSAAVMFLYRFIIRSEAGRTKDIYGSVLLAGFAFLCKGPIGIVLIGLPFLLWSAVRRDFSWLRRIPWLRSIVLFIIVVAPWFVLSEIENPGFIKYFFWNENVARFLIADYGDRYGTGHMHPYGMSWAMLLLAFCPWTLFLGWTIFKNGWKRSWAWLREDSHLLFAAVWGLSAPIFFTFVRQLHAMYLLPAIPGLAIVTASFVMRSLEFSENKVHPLMAKPIIWFFISAWVVVFIVGGFLHFSMYGPILGIFIFALALASLIHVRRTATAQSVVNFVAAICFGTYFTVLASLTPYIDRRRSAEEILKEVVKDSTSDPAHIHRIGIIAHNSYSPYWTANAWATELGQQVDVKFVALTDMATTDVCHVLVKANSLSRVPVEITSNFEFAERVGDWVMFRRNPKKSLGQAHTDAHE